MGRQAVALIGPASAALAAPPALTVTRDRFPYANFLDA